MSKPTFTITLEPETRLELEKIIQKNWTPQNKITLNSLINQAIKQYLKQQTESTTTTHQKKTLSKQEKLNKEEKTIQNMKPEEFLPPNYKKRI